MPRKFISFLGAIAYERTQYYRAPDRSDLSQPIYYVQAALLDADQRPWGMDDQILVFCTADALEKNYHNRAQRNGPNTELIPNDGLENALENLRQRGRIHRFEAVEIPNGNSEAEIWEVFKTVLSRLEEGDEVTFDLTFGFRTLPMLAMTLLHYAKAIKNIRIEGIFYGNFEAGRAERVELAKNLANPEAIPALPQAPILNLLAFSALQDWTSAAQTFLQAGNAQPLASLATATQPGFGRGISDFTSYILTSRGYGLTKQLDVDALKKLIDLLGEQSNIEAQLHPLLEKIQTKLQPFKTGAVENGFHAVQWCIEHGLVQQGITFLQESTVSYVVEYAIGARAINHPFYRDLASAALNGIPNAKRQMKEKKRYKITFTDEKIEGLFKQISAFVASKPGLVEAYGRLTGKAGFRNDINHCGFKDEFLLPEQLKQELENLANSIFKILDIPCSSTSPTTPPPPGQKPKSASLKSALARCMTFLSRIFRPTGTRSR